MVRSRSRDANQSATGNVRSLVIGSGSAVQHIRAPVSTVSFHGNSLSRDLRVNSSSAANSYASTSHVLWPEYEIATTRSEYSRNSSYRPGSASRYSGHFDSEIYTVEPRSGLLVSQSLTPSTLTSTQYPSSSRPRSSRGSPNSSSSRHSSSGHRPIKIFFAGASANQNGRLPQRHELQEIYVPADYPDLDQGHIEGDGNTHVRLVTLGQGHAKGYEEQVQYGKGDHSQANRAIEDLIRRTAHLHDDLMTLEQFVKRNRQLFPEDTVVYQKIYFHELNAAKLRQLGEPPGSVVYEVKVKERLIVPEGSDVISVLRRHYKNHADVDVEYRATSKVGGVASSRRHVTDDVTASRRSQRDDASSYKFERRSKTAPPKYEDENEVKISTNKKSNREDTWSYRSKYTPPSQPYEKQEKHHTTYKTTTSTETFQSRTSSNKKGIESKSEIEEVKYVPRRQRANNTTKAKSEENEKEAVEHETAEHDVDVKPIKNKFEPKPKKPSFLVEPHPKSVRVGDRVIFEVQALGHPIPTLTWFKDNDPISDVTRRVHVTSDQHGGSKLIIQDVETSDQGVYSCQAVNAYDKTRCTVSLRVAPADVMTYEMARALQAVEGLGEGPSRGRKGYGTPPSFVQLPPTDITVHEGDKLTLTCIVDGDPRPTVTWTKGARELQYSQRHRVMSTNNYHLLEVVSVIQTDPGQYTAIARNNSGEVQCSTWVSVLPRVHDDDFTTDFGGNEISFVYDDDSEFGVETTPVRRPVIITTSYDDDDVIFHAKPITVTHAPISPSAVTYVENEPIILDVEPSEATPIVITQPLYNRQVKENGLVKLTVKVKSLTPFEVKWFKDGHEMTLEGDEHYEFWSDDKEERSLIIYNVVSDDVSSYTCQLENGAGFTTNTTASLSLATTTAAAAASPDVTATAADVAVAKATATADSHVKQSEIVVSSPPALPAEDHDRVTMVTKTKEVTVAVETTTDEGTTVATETKTEHVTTVAMETLTTAATSYRRDSAAIADIITEAVLSVKSKLESSQWESKIVEAIQATLGQDQGSDSSSNETNNNTNARDVEEDMADVIAEAILSVKSKHDADEWEDKITEAIQLELSQFRVDKEKSNLNEVTVSTDGNQAVAAAAESKDTDTIQENTKSKKKKDNATTTSSDSEAQSDKDVVATETQHTASTNDDVKDSEKVVSVETVTEAELETEEKHTSEAEELGKTKKHKSKTKSQTATAASDQETSEHTENEQQIETTQALASEQQDTISKKKKKKQKSRDESIDTGDETKESFTKEKTEVETETTAVAVKDQGQTETEFSSRAEDTSTQDEATDGSDLKSKKVKKLKKKHNKKEKLLEDNFNSESSMGEGETDKGNDVISDGELRPTIAATTTVTETTPNNVIEGEHQTIKQKNSVDSTSTVAESTAHEVTVESVQSKSTDEDATTETGGDVTVTDEAVMSEVVVEQSRTTTFSSEQHTKTIIITTETQATTEHTGEEIEHTTTTASESEAESGSEQEEEKSAETVVQAAEQAEKPAEIVEQSTELSEKAAAETVERSTTASEQEESNEDEENSEAGEQNNGGLKEKLVVEAVKLENSQEKHTNDDEISQSNNEEENSSEEESESESESAEN